MDERRKEKRSVIVVAGGRGTVVNLGNARDGPVARQPKPVIIDHSGGVAWW